MAIIQRRFLSQLILGSAENVELAMQLFASGDDRFGTDFQIHPHVNPSLGQYGVTFDSGPNGDPAHVQDFVETLVQGIPLAGLWTLEWAQISERAGLYGGGAFIVDLASGRCFYIDTTSWVAAVSDPTFGYFAATSPEPEEDTVH